MSHPIYYFGPRSSPEVTFETLGLKCPKGHNLVPFTLKRSTPFIRCDVCQKSFTKDYQGLLYGCRACNYDRCPECAAKLMSTTRTECWNGHPLALVLLYMRFREKPCSGIICDVCRKGDINLRTCSEKYPLLYCSICGFDMCPECATKKK